MGLGMMGVSRLTSYRSKEKLRHESRGRRDAYGNSPAGSWDYFRTGEPTTADTIRSKSSSALAGFSGASYMI
jgi:hypothetical protein